MNLNGIGFFPWFHYATVTEEHMFLSQHTAQEWLISYLYSNLAICIQIK